MAYMYFSPILIYIAFIYTGVSELDVFKAVLCMQYYVSLFLPFLMSTFLFRSLTWELAANYSV